jgi:hypothetical protein
MKFRGVTLQIRTFQRSNVTSNLDRDFVFCNLKVLASLEIHPKNRGVLEVAPEAERCISCDASALVDNIGNPRKGNAKIHRHAVHA